MKRLSGKRVLVTSGPTRGRIDVIRYISNISTGRLAVLIAEEALKREAQVTFIYGKESQTPHSSQEAERLCLVEVETVDDLIRAVREEMGRTNYDAIVHAMAVLDYVPESYISEKTPSGKEEWWIKLVKTPKVIKIIRELAPGAFLIGFKLQYNRTKEELIRIAHNSLLNNKANLVLANDLADIERGEHIGYLIDPQGQVVAVAKGKEEIARKIIDAIG
jgi:phosphopantothenoylcysteine synthetase/decarboxylase